MGAFIGYMRQFATESSKSNGFISRKGISGWFDGKIALKRDGYKDQMIFDMKTAVVVVGVSGIGKTTSAKKLAAQVPGMKYISYDDAMYQMQDEMERGKKVSDERILEIVEEKLLLYKEENIVVDAALLNPAYRAALMRFLRDLGYQIFQLYFSKEYTEKNLDAFITRRSIELVLFEDYRNSHDLRRFTFHERMAIRDDIMNITARDKHMTIQELCNNTAKRLETIVKKAELVNRYNQEVEKNRVWWQEKRDLFLLGADYVYFL